MTSRSNIENSIQIHAGVIYAAVWCRYDPILAIPGIRLGIVHLRNPIGITICIEKNHIVVLYRCAENQFCHPGCPIWKGGPNWWLLAALGQNVGYLHLVPLFQSPMIHKHESPFPLHRGHFEYIPRNDGQQWLRWHSLPIV